MRIALILLGMVIAPAVATGAGYAELRIRGDVDSSHTAGAVTGAIERLGASDVGLILIVMDGDRTRGDLLFELLGVFRESEPRLAVYLDDRDDRRVGPGVLALALAADEAGIGVATRVARETGDGLSGLNPAIEDWAVVGLDLRHVAGEVASDRGLAETWIEGLVSPRTDLWVLEDGHGVWRLVEEESPGASRVVRRSREGWSFGMDGRTAGRVYGIGVHRSERSFLRALGLRGRPVERVEIESGLREAHAACLDLIERTRAAIAEAEVVLDVRGNRRGREALQAQDYHAAAESAAGLVGECRAAVAEVDRLTGVYPEILQMRPPADARTPTEIGGASRSSLSAWRDAVRDAERELAWLDERIDAYRRR